LSLKPVCILPSNASSSFSSSDCLPACLLACVGASSFLSILLSILSVSTGRSNEGGPLLVWSSSIAAAWWVVRTISERSFTHPSANPPVCLPVGLSWYAFARVSDGIPPHASALLPPPPFITPLTPFRPTIHKKKVHSPFLQLNVALPALHAKTEKERPKA